MAPNLLDGGVAFITGAASGIGAATAAQFIKYGASALALTDINASGLASVREKLSGSHPHVEIETFEMDVTSESSIIAAHQAAVNRFGRIDYAVNNAGTPGKMKPTSESSLDEFMFGVNINMLGVWIGEREQIKQMLKQDPLKAGGSRGTIVNLSSIYGVTVGKNTTSYCAAKHAVLGITRSDAANYAKDGIRVNAVCPGFTDTPMIRMPGAGDSVGMQEYINITPMGRLGKAEEIANAIVFLSSSMSSYMTGSNLMVDGGFMCV